VGYSAPYAYFEISFKHKLKWNFQGILGVIQETFGDIQGTLGDIQRRVSGFRSHDLTTCFIQTIK
jgi:hypothetical protein